MDEAEVVRQLRQVGEQVRNHFAALSARFEVPERSSEVSIFTLKCDQLLQAGHWLAVALDQFGFVVPRLQMTASARTENDQDVPGFRSKVRRPGGIGMLRGPLRADRRFVCAQQTLFSQQRNQRDSAQSGPAKAQKIAPVE